MSAVTCKCPQQPKLPLGVIAPSNSNQCRALRQAQLVTQLPGTLVTPTGTLLKSGTYVVPENAVYQAPRFLYTVYFDSAFVDIPIIDVTIDDYGNNPAWVVHVRNRTRVSFDLVLKNADKGPGVSFAITWHAIGK